MSENNSKKKITVIIAALAFAAVSLIAAFVARLSSPVVTANDADLSLSKPTGESVTELSDKSFR